MSENKAYVHPKTGNLMSPKGRILWSSLFAPRKVKGGGEGKHEFTLLVPKDADLSVMKEAAVDAGKERFAKTFKDAGGKWPSSIRSPWRKTAENDKLVAALEDAEVKVEDFPVYFAARSKDKPGVVGPNGKSDGVDSEQVYAGRWARCSVQAFAYEQGGNKGVTFGLVNVQLLDNDDELSIGGSKPAAESEFDAVEGAGDDNSSSDSVFD